MIPNYIHLIFGLTETFDDKPFSMMHYMAAKSAKLANPNHEIHIWYQYEPQSIWWERLKDFATLRTVKGPAHIYNRPLYIAAHKADIIRLELLRDIGGAYIDFDVICIRSFDDLRKHEMVMGLRDSRGLCNATMLAKPNCAFVNKWLLSYKNFRSKGYDKYYDEHSLTVPMKLYLRYPKAVHVLQNTAFFYPRWQKIPNLVNGPDKDLTRESYSVHLWERATWNLFKDMTPESLQESKSEFARLTRHLVKEFVAK